MRRSPRSTRTRRLIECATAALVVASLGACHTRSGVRAEKIAATWHVDMTSRLRAQHASTSPSPGERIGGSSWVRKFYERRSYRPAWLGPNGLLSQTFELIGCLREAGRDGLYPSDYRVSEIEAVAALDFDPWGDRKSAAQLEFMLTNAFLEFSDHLLRGRLESRGVNSEWQVGSVEADLAGVLQTALDRHQIRKTLDSLRPRQIAYVQLQEALVLYEGIAASGGWGEIPQVGADAAKKQAAMQRRLRLSGDLPPGAEPGKASMAVAIGRFQARHGLEVSGFMNEKTRAAMNVSASRRADQVRANLERWRWLPHELGSRSIVVRIADFEIDLIEDGQVIESMRAVVGRPYRRTPLFSSYMTHVIFQPTWNIPRRIATEEILPILRRDEGYLRSREILVLDNRGQVRHEPIDWENLGSDEFNYQLVQAPGPFNPLGRVKFTFPNSFEVAIHDTPQKDLFSERVRDFSHGCIRAENAEALASFVLRDDPSWNRSRISAALDASRTKAVPLREPVPVYVLYWTVWVDEVGEVQFRADLYDIDRQLIEALSEAREHAVSG